MDNRAPWNGAAWINCRSREDPCGADLVVDLAGLIEYKS